MRLLKLRMQNIGPYNMQEIDFSSTDKHNVILICGENGAGKTTIQKAMKIGLFGSYLYGLKTNSKNQNYIDNVKELIKNNCLTGSINIEFSVVDEYMEKKYSIYRNWNISDGFKEDIQLYINDERIIGNEMNKQIEYINHYFTPNLIDCIMFDGEKIISLIDKEKISDYLKSTIHHLFNLNYYLNLINDINKYINNDLKKESMTIEQIQLSEVEKKLNISSKTLKSIDEKIGSLSKMKENINFQIDKYIEEYSNMTGIRPDETKKLSSFIKKIEQKKNEYNELEKKFIENDLIFLINEKFMLNTINQIKDEVPNRYANQLNEMLLSNLFDCDQKRDLHSLKESIIISKNNYINFNIEKEKQFELFIERLSDHKQMYSRIVNEYEDNNDLLKSLRAKKMISESKIASELVSKINQKVIEKNKIEEQIFECKQDYNVEEKKYNLNNLKLNELKETVNKQMKENNSYAISIKYRNICQKFYNSEVNELIDLISKNALKLLLKTYKKKNFITDLKITRTFEVELFYNDEKKNIYQLSAGEKQILIACIIVSTINASNRNLPLLFDTPAGRLDNGHMLKFYKNVMINTNNQVIIMPTSKEINNEIIDQIKDKISSCFTIVYNPNGYSEIKPDTIFNEEWNKNGTKNKNF